MRVGAPAPPRRGRRPGRGRGSRSCRRARSRCRCRRGIVMNVHGASSRRSIGASLSRASRVARRSPARRSWHRARASAARRCARSCRARSRRPRRGRRGCRSRVRRHRPGRTRRVVLERPQRRDEVRIEQELVHSDSRASAPLLPIGASRGHRELGGRCCTLPRSHGRPQAKAVAQPHREAPRPAQDGGAGVQRVPDVPRAPPPAPRLPQLRQLQGQRGRRAATATTTTTTEDGRRMPARRIQGAGRPL